MGPEDDPFGFFSGGTQWDPNRVFNLFDGGFFGYDDGYRGQSRPRRYRYEPTSEPRDGYLDGGIVMKEGFTITNHQMLEMERELWSQLDAWANSMSNIVVDEVLENRMLHVYDAVPCITTMEA